MKFLSHRFPVLFASLVGPVWLASAADPVATPRPPAASLTRPATPEKAPGAAGFIQRWSLLEPIPVNGLLTDSAVRATVKAEYFTNQLSVLPADGDKVMVQGKEFAWHAVDTKEYNVNLYHFAYALGKPTSNVLFWGVTIINCPREMPNVRLAIGSNASSIWWVNGREVIGIYGDRQTVVDDGVSPRVTLKKGANVIRCAVVNGGGATDFCARILDAEGEPISNGYTISLSAPNP